MRVLREVIKVRLEVDLVVAVGELSNLEHEFERFPPKDFLAAWLPEVRDVRMMVKLKEKLYDKEKNQADKRKGNKPKQIALPFSPNAD